MPQPTLPKGFSIIWGPNGPTGGGTSSLKVQDAILYRALRLARVTNGPGRTPNPEQYVDALISLNGLLDSLNIQPGAIYTVQPARYTLAPPKTFYTIGIDPTGAVTADFQAPRPIHIDRARLVLTSSPSPVYLPLHIATDAQWASIVVREIPVTIPQIMYCNYDHPIAKLFFWGYPTQANDLEMWTWQPLTQFTSLNDPVVAPAGYLDMLTYQLAVRLGDQFGTSAAMSPNVAADARRMLGRVKALNDPNSPIGSADAGAAGRRGGGDFNYLTGTIA
jgi:hypothetical protein